MPKKVSVNLSSLKDQVYDYFRYQMRIGELRPGEVIDMNATSQKLGVSKTPLRDAIIQLEMEGFVTILPRRGVLVNVLSIQDIKDIYEILGALESTAILSALDRMKDTDVAKMRKLNEGMRRAIARDDFALYYEKNLQLHDVFIGLSGNRLLQKAADILKKRLYDFPRRSGYVKEWEESSIEEHERLIDLISKNNFKEAANFIRDCHWSFETQKRFIDSYYHVSSKNIRKIEE